MEHFQKNLRKWKRLKREQKRRIGEL